MINRAVLNQVEEAIDCFEENWSSDSREKINTLLEAHDLTDDLAALTELIRVDIELRYQHGIPVELEDYFNEFGKLLDIPTCVAQIAFEDFRSRSAQGHTVATARWEHLPGIRGEIWFQQLVNERSATRIGSRSKKPHGSLDPDPAFEAELEAAGFRLAHEIGQGALSRVYLATQQELADRHVVLKVVDQPLAEPQSMAMLLHTNIVPIYSFHRILSRSVICMPYAGSLTLQEFLKDKLNRGARSGESLVVTVRRRVSDTTILRTDHELDELRKPAPLIPAADDNAVLKPLEQLRLLDCNELAVWIFQRLAAALAHSHARGVLHGDLKPANVLIRNDGEPALLDFNLAQSLDRQTSQIAGGIQAIYGARNDPYEQVDNGQLQVATLIPTPLGFDPGTDVVRTRGSLVSGTDVDHYEIAPIAGQDTVTIRLKAAGVSLLKSRLEILDSTGQLIDQAQAESVFANDNTLQITGLQNHSVIYLRVSATDPDDVYAVGDYELEVDYRSAATLAADPVSGSYDAGADSLFTNFSLVDVEQGNNDTLVDAEIAGATAFHPGTRYEIESSVSSATDVDVWKLAAPDEVNGRLVIDVAAVGVDQPGLRVRVVDSAGQSVGAVGRLRQDGTWSLEVAQPEASQDYYVRVSVDPNSTVDVGNYVVTAEFAVASDQMNDLVSGDVSTSVDEFTRWTATKSKLFRFDLNADGGATGEGVRLIIYDAHTQESRLVVVAPSGVTRTAFAWLPQGEYILRLTAISRSGDPVPSINYSVTADGISDDQDEDGEDPEDPSADDYYYQDPGIDPYYSYIPSSYIYTYDYDYANDEPYINSYSYYYYYNYNYSTYIT